VPDPERPTLPAPLRAFASRDFRLFFAGQLVSLVGTWMQSVAQSWLVLELTNSPFLLGLIGTLQFAPVLALSFVAGALADRLPKRRLLVVTQSLMGVQALVLAALVHRGHVEYWHVAALATAYGVANTVDMTTRQAFIVEMVGRDALRSAIALNSAMFNGARVVGPALAGLVIARWGPPWRSSSTACRSWPSSPRCWCCAPRAARPRPADGPCARRSSRACATRCARRASPWC